MSRALATAGHTVHACSHWDAAWFGTAADPRIVVFDRESTTDSSWQLDFAQSPNEHPAFTLLAFADNLGARALCTSRHLAVRDTRTLARPANPDSGGWVARAVVAAIDQIQERTHLATLHGRVLVGDSQAASEVAQLLLLRIRHMLRRRVREEPDLIETVADDAILVYLGNPSAYDSTRGGLVSWLIGIALNKLHGYRRSTFRRDCRECQVGVDLSQLGPPSLPDDVETERESWIAERECVLRRTAKTPQECALIDARLAGASSALQVQALGLAHLPAAEAVHIAYRVWENVVRRARRQWIRSQP